jgi:DNA-binding Lrp family transcriptional regulator
VTEKETKEKVIDRRGIGTNNEKSLHSDIKNLYSDENSKVEYKVGSYIIDVIKEDIFYEIQTKNFYAIGRKLKEITEENNKVVLVHPIAVEKYIVTLDKEGQVMSRRKSPKKGILVDVFDELVSTPYLLGNENFKLEVLMTVEEEIRKSDGKGSWRRKGISIVDRKLVEVIEKHTFNSIEDFNCFLPKELPEYFTNKDLAATLNVPVLKVRKITYTLKNAEIIKECGKRGREILFCR